MKFLLTALLLTTTFFSTAQAGDPVFGRITLTDGSTIFRISIGDERDQRPESLMRRVRNLEQAVGELQAKVYDLQREPVRNEKTVFVCSTKDSFGGSYIGQGDTQLEGEFAAKTACEQKRHPMHCQEKVACFPKVIKL